MVARNASESKSPATDDGIVELSLMMSRRQFEALETRASAEGMSVAQLLRQLVRDAVEELPAGVPD